MTVRPFAATFCRPDHVPDLVDFLAQAKEKYTEFQDEGYFADVDARAVYIYQVTVNGETRTGLVAAVAVSDYLEERVRRHEHTLVAKEVRQAELLKERGAVVKPILLAHRHHEPLADLLSTHAKRHPPLLEMNLEAPTETHRFWAVTDADELVRIERFFAKDITKTYIADGHHRFSAIARLYQKNEQTDATNPYAYVMCALFPSTSLQIHNFNRAVKYDADLSPLRVLARISHYADLEPLAGPRPPATQHELTLYMEGEWFRLHWRPRTLKKNTDAGLPTLDVSMLNYHLLQKVLGLGDIRNDKRIKYIEGPAGLTALVDACENRAAIAFCLHPLSWESFFRVIDHGLVLPPKSTWFEPRMRNGVIVQKI